jgi:Cdc6-like AAA superfamily ATPase
MQRSDVCSSPLCAEGGIQYICGVPGTGKTACVMEVLGAFRAEQQEEGPGAATATQLVVLNCLQLPTPNHVFTRLWEKLSGQRLGPARCMKWSLVHHLLFCLPSLCSVLFVRHCSCVGQWLARAAGWCLDSWWLVQCLQLYCMCPVCSHACNCWSMHSHQSCLSTDG